MVVVSDTHNHFHSLWQIVQKHLKEAYCFIHLGDGCREVEDIRNLYPDILLYSIRGNCDFESGDPWQNQVVVGGKSIFFAHGHTYQVKYGLEPLKCAARNVFADIVLYGHTHQGYRGYDDGLYSMNPGSPVQPRNSKASYGVIDITKAGIVLNLIEV